MLEERSRQFFLNTQVVHANVPLKAISISVTLLLVREEHLSVLFIVK